MSKKATISKKALSIALAASISAAGLSCVGFVSGNHVNAADNTYQLADEIQEGTILHCFDWTYQDIKKELENIAKAGFTSIQTSPVQPSAGQGAWYWLYQPTSFSVGTTELGTKEELKELCEAADAYGIKVIVDVVANHLAGDHSVIQKDLVPEEYWHDGKYNSDLNNVNWNDRYQVTHCDLGMPDLNSENEYVQQVVADYINELKEIGVDGIRWDAAKHIGVPSEECNFWSVVTASGLYNYGEILSGPVDNGGEDVMKEYTEYMSVTDSDYGTALRNAFNSGKAPAAAGNWTEEGIAANKLVYWGESHDNYANKEGKESNGVAQNVIDRAYAVAAARSEASSIYLSRPAATARDSIRIGVKGSMHFTSAEIAAVNHFHNAMVGKEDNYTVSNNCAVVTRKDGGAVIVCGSGSGEVTVENAGSFVPAGTYQDEVTGNTFTVTADTITGTVGESGIAVVYQSDFISRVSASVETGTSFKDTLKVTLHTLNASEGQYETSEGKSGSFADGDVIELGSATQSGVITLKLRGISDSKEVNAVYEYTKLESRKYPEVAEGGIVFDNSATNWKKINIYVYDEVTTPGVTVTNAAWPGVEMTDCGEDYYSYQLPEKFADCKNIMVIFNNGSGDQIPGAMQAGQTMNYTDKKLYDGTKWGNLPENEVIVPESSEPSVEESSKEESKPESSEPSEISQTSTEESKPESGKETSQESKTESTTVITPNNTNNNTGTNTNNNTNTNNTQNSTVSENNNSISTSDSSMLIAAMAVLAVMISGAVILRNTKKREQ